MKRLLYVLSATTLLLSALWESSVYAQDDDQDYDDFADGFGEEDDEPALRVYGSVKLQAGVFVPLISDITQRPKDEAYFDPDAENPQSCDPVELPYNACTPVDHAMEYGTVSMGRGTLQLEAEWQTHPDVVVFGILRGVRSMKLKADEEAQPPVLHPDPVERREGAMDWARDNYYTEFEMRELYVDAYPSDWFSLRLGRQQVAWGDLGQYRLLDVINPSDNTWHWGPAESFKDTRIPLWMAKALIEIPSIEHSLELVWAPLFFDDPEDTVNVPLSFVGAWGLPYTNTPGSFIAHNKVYNYPGGQLEDMRGGLQWKGVFGPFNYSLVYFYTHQLTPPIPTYFIRQHPSLPKTDPRVDDLDKFNMEFPRQHIAGFSMEYAFDNPIGMVAKLETAVELPRTYPTLTTTLATNSRKREDFSREQLAKLGLDYDDDESVGRLNPYYPEELITINYGIQLFRPTMIRFLNPTQNFLMVLQMLHTMIPGLTEDQEAKLTQIPSYNDYAVQMHSFTFVFGTRTTYVNGLLSPGALVAYIPPDNGFYRLGLGVRFSEVWNMNISLTDFFGGDPYKSVGLFRDRDEINMSLTCQF